MEHVLITGGSSGLGHEIAKAHLARGDKVTILDVTPSELNASYLRCDLSKPTFHKLPLQNYDRVICNAGISLSGNFKHHRSDQNRKVMDINLHSHIDLVQHLISKRKLNKAARLGFVTSASVYLPWPVALGYAASKAGLDGFAHALGAYLPSHMSVTRVYPGPMKTAHEKYYSGISDGTGSHPSLIAAKILKSMDKRKQKCFPDRASKLFRVLSKIAPGLVRKQVNKKYRKHFVGRSDGRKSTSHVPSSSKSESAKTECSKPRK
jgi:short-subunit dehydrogenase